MSGDDRGATRPFVDRPATEIAGGELDRIAAAAARWFGCDRVEPVRISMNGIYRCPVGILRVARTTVPAAAAIDLARYLNDAGVAVARPQNDAVFIDEPTGCSVTLWAEVIDDGSPIDWSAVGASIARVHALAIDDVAERYPLADPTAFPWWDAVAALDRVVDLLDDRARHSLETVIERTSDWRAMIVVDPVVCHGDLHPGNVMSTADGPVLLDWDLMCRAHRGWDHAPLLAWARVWGGDVRAYEDFVAGYGADLSDDPTTAMIAELRLVVATLMRLDVGRRDPVAAAEAARRLDYWRTGRLTTPWISQ